MPALRSDQAEHIVKALRNRAGDDKDLGSCHTLYTGGVRASRMIGDKDRAELKTFFDEVRYFGISQQLLIDSGVLHQTATQGENWYLDLEKLGGYAAQPHEPLSSVKQRQS